MPEHSAPEVWWTGRLLLAGIVASGALGSWAATWEPSPVSAGAATTWSPPSSSAATDPTTTVPATGASWQEVRSSRAAARRAAAALAEQAAERERRQLQRARRADRELAAFVEASDRLRAQARAQARAQVQAQAAAQVRAQAQSARTAPLPAPPSAATTGAWVAPIRAAYRVTATFGQSGSRWSNDHTGLDLAAPSGTPVHAVAAGRVTEAGTAGAYGNKVEVTHADGTRTWYCHLSRIDVAVGQGLGAGTQLGTVGSTGNSTGPHLHLEVRPAGGSAIDPRQALAARGVVV